MENIYIKSLGYYIPEGRMTNETILNQFHKVNEGRFSPDDLAFLVYGCRRKFEFLGIESRSCCATGDNSMTMATKASQRALAKTGLSAEQIDCLIFSGVNNPYREPSFAMALANQLGFKKGDFFDLNDTCNGWLKSIELAGLYLAAGTYKNILLVTSENPLEIGPGFGESFLIDETDDIDRKLSALYAGSGAGALILSRDPADKKIVFYGEERETANWDSSLYTTPNLCLPKTRYPKVLNGVWADPRSISVNIIQHMPPFIKKELGEHGVPISSIDFFFTHQLGDNVTFATLNALGVARDKAPVNTFKEYGNLASANLPVALGLAEERGLLQRGKRMLCLSSACGLTFAIALMETAV